MKVDWNQGRITHQDTMKADGLLAILQKDRKGIIESFVEDFKTMFDYDGFRGDFGVFDILAIPKHRLEENGLTQISHLCDYYASRALLKTLDGFAISTNETVIPELHKENVLSSNHCLSYIFIFFNGREVRGLLLKYQELLLTSKKISISQESKSQS